MKVTLISHTPDPVQRIEEAASTCYQSEPTNGKIMKQCYLDGHHSVLEHVSFTFKIEGVSRALLAQLTRHRIGASFSVQSQRYCDMTGSNFVTPDTILNNQTAFTAYMRALNACAVAYSAMVEQGIPKEDARYILPNATTTILTMTMNLRELVAFCNLRLCSRSQWEIRRMSKMLVDEVNKATNNAFSYMLVPACERNPDYPYCPESASRTCGRHPRLKEIYRKSRKEEDPDE